MRRLGAVAVATVLALGGCGDDGEDEGDAAAFCDRLGDLSRNDPFQAFGPKASSDEIAAAFDALVERSAALVDVAPPEARGAARDYAESAARLDELLDDAGHDPAQVDVAAYRDAEVTYADAAHRLERHLEAEC